MQRLPIFKAPPPSPLDNVHSLEPNAGCTSCGHAGGKAATCLPVEGEPGGVLVVDSFPSTAEARNRRHLLGSIGTIIRGSVQRYTKEPVAYVTAMRCAPKSGASGDTIGTLVPAYDACAPYLKHAIEQVQPTRIIALGAGAIYALTGATVQASTTRKGYAWLKLPHGWVPVFYCPSPHTAAKNKFVAKWLEEDFAFALSAHHASISPPPVPEQTWAHLVATEQDAKESLAFSSLAEWTAVDCEWAGRPYDRDFKLLSVALTPKGCEDSWVFTNAGLKDAKVRVLLSEWLRDPKHKKIGSYFKSDTVALHAALGIWTRGVTSDTRLLRKLIDAEASGKLADMAHLVGRGGHKDELAEAKTKAVGEYLRARAKGGLFKVSLPGLAEQSHGDKLVAGAEKDCYGFAFVDLDLLYRYNAADTVVTAMLGALLEKQLQLEPEGMQHVARSVVVPASDTYARVEAWGIRVEREALETLGQYLDVQIREVEDRMAQYGYNRTDPKAGKFQPGSPQSLGRFLFGELGLKSTSTTDTGKPATDAEALEELSDQHPVVKDILQWRGLTKMRTSYVDNILGYIRDDGRVHPTIHPDGARTGRTSSSHPNLQVMPSVESNDPAMAEMARMFRDAFAPPHGYSLLEVDYSQLELRVAADLSGDPAMLDIFKQGKDFHLQTAHLLSHAMWGITPEHVTDAHRREVKPYVFGLLYDDSPYGLAMRVGVEVEKAEKIKDAVFGCFPLLGKWIRERVAESSKTGAAWTWWAGKPARRRPLVEIATPETPIGKTQRRSSWNTPIQGTGNEYLVASANKVVEWLVGDGVPAKLLVTIHDSMLMEVRNDCMSEVQSMVLDIMASHPTKNGVPLAADAKCGPTWARMVKWKRGTPCPIEGCK